MSAASGLTPFTDTLKKRFAELDTGSASYNSSNNSSLQVSPRGVAAHHHQPREGSVEADECGWIQGYATTDGTAPLSGGAEGVTYNGSRGSVLAGGLARLGGGTIGGGGYTAPGFTSTSTSFLSTSGINMTPRAGDIGGGGPGMIPPMGAASSRNAPYGSSGADAGGGGGGATAFSGRNQPLNYGSSDTDTGTGDDYDDEDEDDEEDDDFEESDEEAAEEEDVLPKRYRPKVTTGPGVRGRGRGFEEQLDVDNLTDKAEFESFGVVTSLLDLNGAATRRDLLEYHTPVQFLQFLEQLMCGAYFVRFYRKHGTPHERYLYLRMIEVEPGLERPFFCQCKHATAVQIDDCVPVSDLVGVVAGDDAPAFQRQMTAPGFVRGSFVKSRRPHFSTKGALSLYFWDRKGQKPRSLDILTTNMSVFRLWKLSCEALVAVNSVKLGAQAQSAQQVMRSYFLAAQRAIQAASRGGVGMTQ